LQHLLEIVLELQSCRCIEKDRLCVILEIVSDNLELFKSVQIKIVQIRRFFLLKTSFPLGPIWTSK